MRTPIQPEPLRDIRLDVMACQRCRFGAERKNACPGDGDATAPIFMIGEAPGRLENKTGKVFSGAPGDKLDEWLWRAGLRREHLFVTNVLKCAPLKEVEGENGMYLKMSFPEDDEPVDKCLKWLDAQLRIVQPRAVILLGERALHHVLLRGAVGQARPFGPWISKLCRRRDKYGETRFACILHPARLVRSPNPYDEADCVEALVRVKEYVNAVQKGEMPPLEDLHEVKSLSPPQYQHRLRLFGREQTGTTDAKADEEST